MKASGCRSSSLERPCTNAHVAYSAIPPRRGATVPPRPRRTLTPPADKGKVEKGSYLLVESLDRLSRDTVRVARDRFEAILDRGINIAVLSEGKVYKADSYDMSDMIMSLLVMQRANEESAMKSKRGRAAWQQKKKRAAETGDHFASLCVTLRHFVSVFGRLCPTQS